MNIKMNLQGTFYTPVRNVVIMSRGFENQVDQSQRSICYSNLTFTVGNKPSSSSKSIVPPCLRTRRGSDRRPASVSLPPPYPAEESSLLNWSDFGVRIRGVAWDLPEGDKFSPPPPGGFMHPLILIRANSKT